MFALLCCAVLCICLLFGSPCRACGSEFERFEEQQATKFEFNLQTRKWQQQHIRIRMDPVPFAVGGLRRVHHMQEIVAGRGVFCRFHDRDDELNELHTK